MMRVLWLSMNPGLYGIKGGNDSYNGGGWIASLQRLLANENIELGLVFLSETQLENLQDGNVSYYPICRHLSKWQKIRFYYGAYKHNDTREQISKVVEIIENFHPDLIHIFGLENPLINIVEKIKLPIIVHLQGLLGPCSSAYFPPGISNASFLWPPSKREWILRNGFLHMKNYTSHRATQEAALCKMHRYVMGRTKWDYQITQLYAPQIQYFHVNEVLRPVFYENAGKWNFKGDKIRIYSTISENPYKGVDLVIKTSHLLVSMGINHEWFVAGLSDSSFLIRIVEKCVGIKSKDTKITYKGICSAEDLCDDLLTMSMYVHPSHIDNSPNSLCEAQLLGVPCISTNVGGTSSLINDEENGLLIPANDPYSLAYQINRIATDRDLAKRLSRNAALTASKRHCQKEIVKTLIETYSTVITNSQQSTDNKNEEKPRSIDNSLQ